MRRHFGSGAGRRRMDGWSYEGSPGDENVMKVDERPRTRPIQAAPKPGGTDLAALEDAWLVYDGDCPFCSRYVRYVRFRDAVGEVHLVNAREGGPVVDEVVRHGLGLDEGMVLVMGGRLYHGADCIQALALMSSGSDTFNRLNAAVFRSASLARLLYPVLRAGRNGVLRALGRRKIG
jgi:predicted DCC family thiol-disulfide oxidoreductase YuxK